MIVTYCDLCGCPIREEVISLNISEFMGDNNDSFSNSKGKYNTSEYEICSTCKNIIFEIFKKRMIGILKLSSDLKTIYNLPNK